jgi:hypothetical protein
MKQPHLVINVARAIITKTLADTKPLFNVGAASG